MVIVIVGGGKLGFDLAQTLMTEHHYDVRLIEKNKMKCMELANKLDAAVICGDGTELEILEEAGTDMGKVIKTTVFLKDMNDFAAMNEVYKSFFEEGNYPARSAVQVARLPKDVLVEIEAVAAL